MRILLLCHHFKDFGNNPASFRIRYLTALTMAEKGHELYFIYPGCSLKFVTNKKDSTANYRLRILETPGILPINFRTGGFGFLDCLIKLFCAIIFDVDIIQVVSGHRPSNFIPSVIGKYLKRCVIVDECWEWLGQGGHSEIKKGLLGKLIGLYDKFFEIKLKMFFDSIIVISSELKKRFKFKSKIHILYGGAENNNFHEYNIEEARRLLNLPQKYFIIGMSNLIQGDHEDNKVFFKAFRKLCKINSDVFLLATGKNSSYLKEVGNEYDIKHNIISTGYINFDIYNIFLSACNIYVLPYPDTPINRGRWPNKLCDYICLNRPVLTNPTGDIKELFKKYSIGLLCEETDESYYSKLKKFIENKGSLQNYSRDSIFVANNILSFDKRIDNMLQIFTDLLDRRN
jgi:glycosyltransferase involved in cell wall biosynthesis